MKPANTLERLEAEATPACDVNRHCSHTCTRPAEYIVTYRCACPEVKHALVCHHDVRWARVTDFVCVECADPCKATKVEKL